MSEYNTPAPNDAQVETLPLFATLAAFQDWDAIYPYCYLDFDSRYETDHILGFFSLDGNAGELAFMPGAALLFRRALVTPGATPVTLTVSKNQPGPSWDSSALGSLWRKLGTPPAAIAQRRMQVALIDGTAPATISEAVTVAPTVPSDTGEVHWASNASAPRFLVQAPAARTAVGQLSGQSLVLGDVHVEIGTLTKNFAAVSLTALDEKPIADSKKVLLVIGGRFENSEMGWNAARTTVGSNWGHAPLHRRVGARRHHPPWDRVEGLVARRDGREEGRGRPRRHSQRQRAVDRQG